MMKTSTRFLPTPAHASRLKRAVMLALYCGGLILPTSQAQAGDGQGQMFRNLGEAFTKALYAEDYDLAEDIARDRVKLSLGNDDRLGDAYRNLGSALAKQGKLLEAELVERKALPMVERRHGKVSRQAVHVHQNIISVLIQQNRYAEIMPLVTEALNRQQELAPDRVDMLDLMNTKARVLHQLGQNNEALAVLDTADKLHLLPEPMDEGDNRSGPEWIERGRHISLYLRGICQQSLGNYSQASALLNQALTATRASASSSPVGIIEIQSSLAEIYQQTGQRPLAIQTLQDALQLAKKRLRSSNMQGIKVTAQLARALAEEGDFASASTLYKQALAQLQQNSSLGMYSQTARHYAALLERNGQLEDALQVNQKALDAIDQLFAQTRGLDDTVRESFITRFNPNYEQTLRLLVRLHGQQPTKGYDKQALEVVSRTQSRLFSELLKQADAAKLSSNGDYKTLHDKQQSRQEKLSSLRLERSNTGSFTNLAESSGGQEQTDSDAQRQRRRDPQDPIVAERVRERRQKLDDEIRQAQAELTTINTELWQRFPRSMDLAQPKPVSVAQLQEQVLKPGETLLTFFMLPQQTLAFITAKDSFHMVELPIGRQAIGQLVTTLRAPEENGGESLSVLQQLDPAQLYQGYTQLFKPLEPYLPAGNRIISIGDGSLHTLPLEMLVTRWGAQEQQQFKQVRQQGPLLAEYSTLPYLNNRYRFAYLPSLSSLVSMRLYRNKAIPRYDRELVSFADPIFDKADSAAPDSLLGQTLARSYSHKTATFSIPRLPETAVEAKSIAQILGNDSKLYLEEDAQEYTVKKLDLSHTRYLHFATHGLLGGEFAMVKQAINEDSSKRTAIRPEPALLLSLTGNMHGEDGLLTMHEVVEGLNLNAQLVVLSACNTAGEHDAAHSGEGFAGLTRAFMYAGAQGLLVSHWSVESQATQELMVAMFRELKNGTDNTQSIETARQTIKNSHYQLSGQTISRAHPFFWAPFVYVGD